MSTVTNLLSEIDAFLGDTGVAETTFGRRAVNDGKFVKRLREGAGITVATVDRVQAYIVEQRKLMSSPKRRKAA
ncbi:hypothetical protein [Reyranella massiliensis]|uniref:hypothetical protein n=1 Tax=Reyranella massiliensis TaxID=445220 RepID=UPI0005BBB0F6|nr:hypothetical protein [Reyranella massiliensis]